MDRKAPDLLVSQIRVPYRVLLFLCILTMGLGLLPTSHAIQVVNNDTQASATTKVIFTDDFDEPELHSNWIIYNDVPAHWSLIDSPGSLQIIGVASGLLEESNTFENFFLQSPPDGNFTIETSMTLNPTRNYQQGGLIIFQDSGNYIKLDVVFNK